MKEFLVIILFALIVLIDLPSILKKTKGKRTYIIAYSLIIVIGFTISLLETMDKTPVSPAKLIESIVKSITGAM